MRADFLRKPAPMLAFPGGIQREQINLERYLVDNLDEIGKFETQTAQCDRFPGR